eukprot:26862-Amphidinium_carterae.1
MPMTTVVATATIVTRVTTKTVSTRTANNFRYQDGKDNDNYQHSGMTRMQIRSNIRRVSKNYMSTHKQY